MRKSFIALLCLAAAGTANAQIIIDGPGNHSFATASPITRVPGVDYAGVGVGDLTSGEVDFYSIQLQTNELLTTAITPIENGLTAPALELGLFDPTETLVAGDTGISGNGFQSLASYVAPSSGLYYIAVTGSGDDTFSGNHTQSGPYQILVGVTSVPEPASYAVTCLGALCLIRRRSTKKGGQK